MPHNWSDLIRSDLFDSAQEKGLGTDRTVARHRCNTFGRIKRTDQPDPERRPGNRAGLVFAGYVFNGADLRATGKALASVSGTRNIQERVGFGCGLLHVHSFDHTDFIFYGLIVS